MKDAGCVFIFYGVESMDQKVLNNMKKGLRPEMITSGIEQTLEVGISPGFGFIFGNRDDNKETLQKSVDFLLKYDDFSEKRTIRPVTPYPGSPLYDDAIASGLLDKNNAAEDFYENKHLNSDLLCCNFTDMTDKEFYDALKDANKQLMVNHYDRQKESTLQQIDHLYDTLDATFRGFRHGTGRADHSAPSEGYNKTNWENTKSSDADAARFTQSNEVEKTQQKSIKSFDRYVAAKKKRAEEKLLRAKKIQESKKNKEKNISLVT
jgi:hypothetical protein